MLACHKMYFLQHFTSHFCKIKLLLNHHISSLLSIYSQWSTRCHHQTPVVSIVQNTKVCLLFCSILKCDIKMNSGPNDNSGIQFADQENLTIDSNIIQIQPTHVKMKLLPVFGCYLEFWGKGITTED